MLICRSAIVAKKPIHNSTWIPVVNRGSVTETYTSPVELGNGSPSMQKLSFQSYGANEKPVLLVAPIPIQHVNDDLREVRH